MAAALLAASVAAASEPAPVGVPVIERGAVFVWPALDAPMYADPGTRAFAEDVALWRAGAPPARSARVARTTAARFLAADLTYLRAAAGEEDWGEATAAYERALREASEFPEADRAQFLLGHAYLALGFGVEAGAAFATLEQRHPESALLADARLGRAASLRLRRRAAEARALVAEVAASASGPLLCRVTREQAASAETADERVEALRRLAASCPDALHEVGVLRAYTEALVQAGDVEAARAALAAPRPPGRADEDARLRLLAASIAEDPETARKEYEQIAALGISETLAVEAGMKLALLDGGKDPLGASARLLALSQRRIPTALRAVVLGERAALLARAGRFDAALAALERAEALGPDGVTQAEGRRAQVVADWIAGLAERDDAAAIATVYAAHATLVHDLLPADAQRTVARALRTLGLHDRAAALLARVPDAERTPEMRLELAEAALAARDAAGARQAAHALDSGALPAALADRAHAVRARAALLADDGVRVAAADAARVADLGLRAELAAELLARPGGAAEASALLQPALKGAEKPPVRVYLVAGAAALEEGAWDAAAVSFEHALLGGAAGAERTEALAGLLRAAQGDGDPAVVSAALTHVKPSEDPMVRRVAAALKRRIRRIGGEHGA